MWAQRKGSKKEGREEKKKVASKATWREMMQAKKDDAAKMRIRVDRHTHFEITVHSAELMEVLHPSRCVSCKRQSDAPRHSELASLLLRFPVAREEVLEGTSLHELCY